ncbi:MAG: ABC transporter ATP-binding protein [Actinomycetaceae bacterium]|nr:ABC transporter ATP-binding protein [Actinomycetaceae bacterium]
MTLTITDLQVHYGSVCAVDNVSLTIPTGHIIALLGPSGSGKSSLMRAVAGLEAPSGGDISWDGDCVVDVPVHRRGFGLMFQDGQLFPHRDVAGNVAYGLRHLSRAERATRVAEVLDLVGMSDYARRAVTSLSGGQAQRVALARSLAPDPKLLLLDEPLSALDRSLRERLSSEIRRILQAAGSTCIYVTHDQDEAFAVADQIAVMIDGRLAALAAPQDLWANPGSRAVAEFLGFGPFLVEGEGRWRAIPPGMLHVHRWHSPTRAMYERGEALIGQVRDIRGARGYTHVRVDVRGQSALARAQSLPADMSDPAGWQVELSIDRDACPVVSDNKRRNE